MVRKNLNYLNIKIYPNQSLSLIILICFFSFFFIATLLLSSYFFSIGAWPVSLFLLLDFFLIYFAFNKYKRGTKIYDRIVLNTKLHIINVNKTGKIKKSILEPTWLRLKIYSGRKSRYLSIISKGKSVTVGEYLNVKELLDLAKVIKKALIEREQKLTFSN
tara:strand:- start:453 stop:935 length:483 start_codon:yes stop_codon:yes gene_type:complete